MTATAIDMSIVWTVQMIALSFKSSYKSIIRLPIAELPDFVVLTGLNGSGKSHFLQAIADDRIQSGMAAAYYDWTTLRPFVGPPPPGAAGAHGIIPHQARRDDAWRRFEALAQDAESSIRTALRDIPAQGDHTLQQLFSQATDEKNDSLTTDEKRRIVDVITNMRPLSSPVGMPAELKRVELKLAPPHIFVTRDQFDAAYPLQPDPVDAFSGQVGALFTAYYSLHEKNEYTQFKQNKGKQGSTAALSDAEFTQRYGQAPWDVLNRLFATSMLPYRITAPESPEQQYKPRLLRTDDGVEIGFDDLSSGERIIASLVFYSYAAADSRFQVTNPTLLLLDEIDAPLHPSMTVALLRSLRDVIVKEQGKKIILATHSPSTVALAPEDSIYVMHSDRTIEQTSRDGAIRALTAGVPVLSISREHRRQVFVESNNDEEFYTNLEVIVRGELDPDISLSFIASGPDKHQGSSRVIYLLSKLEDEGNDTVFGILDWDTTNEPRKRRLLVLGHQRRYAIENYLLDPVLVAAVINYTNDQLREGVGFAKSEPYLALLSMDDTRLQSIADHVLEELGFRHGSDDLRCEYINGHGVSLPKAMLEMRGHDLETLIKDKYPLLKRYHSEKELKLKVIALLRDLPGFVPKDIVEMFRQIQKG